MKPSIREDAARFFQNHDISRLLCHYNCEPRLIKIIMNILMKDSPPASNEESLALALDNFGTMGVGICAILMGGGAPGVASLAAASVCAAPSVLSGLQEFLPSSGNSPTQPDMEYRPTKTATSYSQKQSVDEMLTQVKKKLTRFKRDPRIIKQVMTLLKAFGGNVPPASNNNSPDTPLKYCMIVVGVCTASISLGVAPAIPLAIGGGSAVLGSLAAQQQKRK